MKMPVSIIILLLVGFVSFGQTSDSISINKNYDKSTNKITWDLPLGLIASADNQLMQILVYAQSPGPNLTKDTKFLFVIISSSEGWKFINPDLTLWALLDGERETIGVFSRQAKLTEKGRAQEILTTTVPLKTLKTIAEKKKVEIHFASTAIEWDRAQINRIRSFCEEVDKDLAKKTD